VNPPSETTIVILTALDVEYTEIRARLAGIQTRTHAAGTRFEVGYLGGQGCMVALALVGKGNQPAAVLAERAIAEFSPTAVMFVGVAGALWPKVALGDVVTATHVYAYHGATSEDDGEKARPRTWEVPHRVLQIAQHLAREGVWAHGLEFGGTPPRAHFGPIAAGEVVQDSAESGNARWIREHYNDALAIEMEAAGVAQAAHLNDSLPMIVIRGISDRADGTKTTTDRAGWQPRAAANAAAFAAALARALAEEPAFAQRGPLSAVPREHDTIAKPIQGITSIARDNARVGIQAGQIFGDVRIGPDAGSGADALMASSATVMSKGTLMATLRHLFELAAQAADLAAKLATAVTAIRGVT
jgi:adenosylhomocysteine nucleosidase